MLDHGESLTGLCLVKRKEYLPVIPAELCMIQDSQGREVDGERMGNDTEHIAIVKRLMVEGEAPLRRAASKKDARIRAFRMTPKGQFCGH